MMQLTFRMMKSYVVIHTYVYDYLPLYYVVHYIYIYMNDNSFSALIYS